MKKFRNRDSAREYLAETHGLEIGNTALANKASDGTGPKYTVINGRALYMDSDLDAWVAEQAKRGAQTTARA